MITNTEEFRGRVVAALRQMDMPPREILYPGSGHPTALLLALFERMGVRRDIQTVSDFIEMEQVLLQIQDELDAVEEAVMLANMGEHDRDV